MALLVVFVGGGLGSVVRYVCIELVRSHLPLSFPAGTLVVNGVGSVLIGFLYKVFATLTLLTDLRLLLLTGFLGGYTTFSTYALETVQYFIIGEYKSAVLNLILSNGLCLLGVIFGVKILIIVR